MSDLPRLSGEPKADDAPAAKRPWNTPRVIEATLDETRKIAYPNEIAIIFAYGPS